MIPFVAIGGNSRTRVLHAVVAIHEERGVVTMPDLHAATGLAAPSIHHHLKRLRRQELVTWDYRKVGSLRPLVYRVREWAA